MLLPWFIYGLIWCLYGYDRIVYGVGVVIYGVGIVYGVTVCFFIVSRYTCLWFEMAFICCLIGVCMILLWC